MKIRKTHINIKKFVVVVETKVMRMEEVVRKVMKPVEPNVVGTNVLGKFLQKIALRKFQIVNGYTMPN